MKPRSRIALVLAALLSFSALSVASFGGTVRVKATSNKTWNPSSKTVAKGTKVVWKNPTGTKHTVTAYSNNWSKDTTIKPGERTSKTFNNRGTYKYRCTIHSIVSLEGTCSGMCGRIKVE